MVTHTPAQQENSVSTSVNLPQGSPSWVTTPPAGVTFDIGQATPAGGADNSHGGETVTALPNDPALAMVREHIDLLDESLNDTPAARSARVRAPPATL